MQANFKIIGPIFLIAALLIVGGIALIRNKFVLPKLPTSFTNNAYPSPQATPADQSKESSKVPVLPSSPSAQQVKVYLETVKNQAVAADTVTFQNCKAQPTVIKLKVGSKLTLKNSDQKAIVANINFDNNFPVPGESSVTVTPKVVAGGSYYMSCQHQASDFVEKALLIEVSK